MARTITRTRRPLVDTVLAIVVRGKGGHERLVPMHPQVADVLTECRGFVFPGRGRAHLHPDVIGRSVSALLGPGWTMHTRSSRYPCCPEGGIVSDIVTLGEGPYGKVVWDKDDTQLVYVLTPCCNATGKGVEYSATFVACRACYRDVDPIYGDCEQARTSGDAREAGVRYFGLPPETPAP